MDGRAARKGEHETALCTNATEENFSTTNYEAMFHIIHFEFVHVVKREPRWFDFDWMITTHVQ